MSVRFRIALAKSPINKKFINKLYSLYNSVVYCLPSKSRLGPTSIAFQLNEYFDGHNVKPS